MNSKISKKIIACISFLFLLVSCSTTPTDDYGDLTISRCGQFLLEKYQNISGSVLRSVSDEFADYSVLFFDLRMMRIHLHVYESPYIVNMCLSQFELPADSEQYMDAAMSLRANADMRAPLVHADMRSTSCVIELYNVNKDNIDLDTFLGEQIDKIQEGLSLVQQYQRIPESEGGNRGAYSRHLDEWKSPYRIEIEKPDTSDEQELQDYWDAVYDAFTLYMDAYLVSLDALEPEDDQVLIQGSIDGIDEFIDTLWEEDMVVEMGKTLFGNEDDFKLYFLDGFWRDRVYYSDVSQQ